MTTPIEFRNYKQAKAHPESARLMQSPLSQHLKSRIDGLPVPVSCILQIDDTRDESQDATQLWISRAVCGRWTKLYQLPVPFSEFEAEKPSHSTTALVDDFIAEFRSENA